MRAAEEEVRAGFGGGLECALRGLDGDGVGAVGTWGDMLVGYVVWGLG